jgi:hypothetical protein
VVPRAHGRSAQCYFWTLDFSDSEEESWLCSSWLTGNLSPFSRSLPVPPHHSQEVVEPPDCACPGTSMPSFAIHWPGPDLTCLLE